MAKHKKSSTVVEDDEMLAEEVGSKVPTGEDSSSEGASDSLSDDDLIGEPELREPEQAVATGSENNAERSAEPDVVEDQPVEIEADTSLPEGFLGMDVAPMSGIRVMLYASSDGYLKAFCKRSRRFIDRRWQMSSKWCDAVTGKDIEFQPLGWRALKVGE